MPPKASKPNVKPRNAPDPKSRPAKPPAAKGKQAANGDMKNKQQKDGSELQQQRKANPSGLRENRKQGQDMGAVKPEVKRSRIKVAEPKQVETDDTKNKKKAPTDARSVSGQSKGGNVANNQQVGKQQNARNSYAKPSVPPKPGSNTQRALTRGKPKREISSKEKTDEGSKPEEKSRACDKCKIKQEEIATLQAEAKETKAEIEDLQKRKRKLEEYTEDLNSKYEEEKKGRQHEQDQNKRAKNELENLYRDEKQEKQEYKRKYEKERNDADRYHQLYQDEKQKRKDLQMKYEKAKDERQHVGRSGQVGKSWVIPSSLYHDDRLTNILAQALSSTDRKLTPMKSEEITLDYNGRVLLPVIAASRVGSDLQAAVEKAKLGKVPAIILIFHHLAPHNCKIYTATKSRLSDRELVDRCQDMLDLVFWNGSMYDCDANDKATTQLRAIAKDVFD